MENNVWLPRTPPDSSYPVDDAPSPYSDDYLHPLVFEPVDASSIPRVNSKGEIAQVIHLVETVPIPTLA